ncbi:MAG TPA: fibronectin type III domain-containing protein [Verrucomicrobiae bacterium]|jgi:hypothetical protein|nr:fibronectin type III domain-containing protein [Verrucomicrobiae bacterium]
MTFCRGLLLAALFLAQALPAGARGRIPGVTAATPYLIYYGNWDSAKVSFAQSNYKVVILHPSSNITPAQIAAIKRGPDNIAGTADDVLVFGYVSVSEDARPTAPVTGDGLGPRVDPRTSDTVPLSTITNVLGDPSPGGVGYASYYLDVKANADGVPDRNPTYGGCYVNPGAPAWWPTLRNMTKAADGLSGMDEILTTTTGNALNCDGLFLDTLDTPAPNSFGGTSFEWTAPGMQSFLQRISTNYPTKWIIGNRGLFFYDPEFKQYPYTLRPYVNMVMFESYFTDSDNSQQISPWFPENKYDYAPKLNAEGSRADGFNVIALDYNHTPPAPADVIAQSYEESMGVQGWLLYRTNPSLNDTFNTGAASWASDNPDTNAPVWDSTAGQSSTQPPPRVGLQEAVADTQSVVLRWDVARDQTEPVVYNVYYTTSAVLDFSAATKLAHVTTSIPTNYLTGVGAGRYPFEYRVTGLTSNATYLFAVRAEDGCAPPHEETNAVILPVTLGSAANSSAYRHVSIDGDFSDWTNVPVLATADPSAAPVSFTGVALANDNDYLYVRFTLAAAARPFSDFNTHVFIDTSNAAAGYVASGTTMHAKFMIESGSGYDERNGSFNAGVVNGVGWALSPTNAGTNFELRISRQAYYSDLTPVFSNASVRVLLQDNRGSILTTAGIPYTFAEGGPYEDWRAAHFTAAELADASISGDAADPDHDGIPNLVEYGFGLDPKAVDHPDLPRASIALTNGADYLDVQLTERNPPSDVQYLLELSSNPLAWTNASSNFFPISSLDEGGGLSLVTMRWQTPITNAAEEFVRVRIQR